MVTFADVRRLALSLPRTTEHLVYGRIKFRIKSIVYVGMAADELSMGFGFPKEERAALVAAEPEKFHMPIPSDERFNWVRVWLDAIDEAEMTELVVDAWRMCVPKRVAREHLGDPPDLQRAVDAAYRLRPVDVEGHPPVKVEGHPPVKVEGHPPVKVEGPAPVKVEGSPPVTRVAEQRVRSRGTRPGGRPARPRPP
jgi:hypothetical protein